MSAARRWNQHIRLVGVWWSEMHSGGSSPFSKNSWVRRECQKICWFDMEWPYCVYCKPDFKRCWVGTLNPCSLENEFLLIILSWYILHTHVVINDACLIYLIFSKELQVMLGTPPPAKIKQNHQISRKHIYWTDDGVSLCFCLDQICSYETNKPLRTQLSIC